MTFKKQPNYSNIKSAFLQINRVYFERYLCLLYDFYGEKIVIIDAFAIIKFFDVQK